MKRIILFIALMMVGCATSQMPTPKEMRADIENFALPKLPEEGKAIVYVIRLSSPGALVTLISFHVFLDDKEPGSEMGYTGLKEYIYFNLTPGNHQILSKAENWSDIHVTVASGDIKFILQEDSPGFWLPRNHLVEIPDYEGNYYVKHLSLGTIIKMDK